MEHRLIRVLFLGCSFGEASPKYSIVIKCLGGALKLRGVAPIRLMTLEVDFMGGTAI